MLKINWRYNAVCIMVVCVSLITVASAAITTTGDVDPTDPATWTSSTDGYIGKTFDGTMDITEGSDVLNDISYIGHNSGSTGKVTIDGLGSTWTNSDNLYIGQFGNGTLNITDGGAVSNESCEIGNGHGSTGEVTVDGSGSTWTNSFGLFVGAFGSGTLNITNSGAVSCYTGHISSHETGIVTVDGAGSSWMVSEELRVNDSGTLYITNGGAVSSHGSVISGTSGSIVAVTVDGFGSSWTIGGEFDIGLSNENGTLNITNGGLVSVAGTLAIDHGDDDSSFVNMSSGGMLTLNGYGKNSINDFLDMVFGSDAIRYWDGTGWNDITNATMGEDYWLDYLTTGDLAGYTMLTVGVPEPATMAMLALGGLVMVRKRQRSYASNITVQASDSHISLCGDKLRTRLRSYLTKLLL